MDDKGHFRNAYKSDHLGVIDLYGLIEKKHNLVFTIKEVIQEINAKVAGRTIPIANILYFVEDIKPLVLNAGNAAILRAFFNSTYVYNWKDMKIQLYIDPNAKFKGEVVGGVRISPILPQIALPRLTKSNVKVWSRAIEILKEGQPIEVIKEKYSLSASDEKQLREDCNNDIT